MHDRVRSHSPQMHKHSAVTWAGPSTGLVTFCAPPRSVPTKQDFQPAMRRYILPDLFDDVRARGNDVDFSTSPLVMDTPGAR